jgi:hypothetical protein
MSGLGQVIGQNVRMVYYDSSPYTIRAMGISSSTGAPSYWIIPGCYYDPGQTQTQASITTLELFESISNAICEDKN